MHFLHHLSGKALVGHVIKTLQVKDDDQCELKCYWEPQCVSYNLGPPQVIGHMCELSKSDHLRHPGDLVARPGYAYTGSEVYNVINFHHSRAKYSAELEKK